MTEQRKTLLTCLLLLMLLSTSLFFNASDGGMENKEIYAEIDTMTVRINVKSRLVPAGDQHFPLSIEPVTTTVIGGGISIGSGPYWEEVTDPTPGAPMAPWLATSITLPGDILSVKFLPRGHEMVRVGGDIAAMPLPVNPWEETGPFQPWEKGPYPEERLRLSHTGYRHQDDSLLHVYSLWISPLVFTLSGDVGYSGDVDVEMEWTDEMKGPTPSRAPGDPVNVPGTLTISSNLDINPIYLIITSWDLREHLAPLADWRNQMGTATSIVAVEDILSEYDGAGDDADCVREYLIDVVEKWNALEFVLLAGDWDKVPTKRVVDSNPYTAWDDGYIPADTYFSCLDGTWDLDGDGLYAEIGDMEDIIPDLYVSRLAINDQAVWEGKIRQIIDYETGRDENGWGSNAILAAANTHNEGDGTSHSEYLWNKYLSSAYEGKSELYESEDNLSIPSIDQAIMEGGGLVQFVDHGGPTVWCDNYGAGVVYRDRDAKNLQNGAMMPVISTLACLTTWFDDTSGCPSQRFGDCLGEAFTENVNGGAVGYIGSSRTSVGILGANRYLPYDNGLQEDYARQIGGLGEYNLGRSFTRAKEHYAEMWSGQFNNANNNEVSMCWLEYTLLGEPALEIWTGDKGDLAVNVQHENDLDPYIIVNVEDENGDPVREANVTLQNFQRGVYSLGTTNEEGVATFELDLDWFCDINLTVRKQNHRPHLGYVRISDVIPPKTSISVDGSHVISRWYTKEVNISLSPNEKGVVHYRIGDGSYMETNESLNYSLPRLGEGLHRIHFFAEDVAGNLEEENHIDVGIDLNDPIAVIAPSPEEPTGENGWYDTEPLITLSGLKDDRGSPVTYSYTIDNGPENVYHESFLLREGDHLIRAWARDLSGRTSNVSETIIRVDTTSPDCGISLFPGSPDGRNGWYRTSPRMNLSADEKDARIEFKLSQTEEFGNYRGDLYLPDGIATLYYRAVDISGNVGPTHTQKIMVDTAPPKAFMRSTPMTPDGENGWFVSTPNLHLTWEDNSEADVMYRMNRGEWAISSGWLEITDGVHDLEFKAVDRAGHESVIEKRKLKVDTRAPTTIVDISGNLRKGWFMTMPVITLNNDEDHIVRYAWNGEEEIDYDMPFEAPGREGFYTLEVYSMDEAGNREPPLRFTLQVDTEEPSVLASVRDLGSGRWSIALYDTRDGSSSLMFRALEGERTLADWSYDQVIEIDLSEGTHMITIEAKDEAGNIGRTTVTVEEEGDNIYPYAAAVMIALVTIIILIILLSRKNKKDIEVTYYHGEHEYGRPPPQKIEEMGPVDAEVLEISRGR